MHPVNLGFFRVLVTDVQCPNGEVIPKGAGALLVLPAIHQSLSIPDAELFCPERWLDPDQKDILGDSLFTFSRGKRGCIGKVKALLDMTTVLGTLIRHLEMSVHTSGEARTKFLIVADGFRVKVHGKRA